MQSVFVLLSLLFTCVLGGWQGNWPSILLTQQQPTAATPPEIPINASNFSTVTLSAAITITNPNANFSLIPSLVSPNGTEYAFPSFDFEEGGATSVQFTTYLDPCTVSGFITTSYSLHYYFAVYGTFGDVDISVITTVNIDDNILHANASDYKTNVPYVYFRVDIPSNYSKYYATVTLQGKNNGTIPFSSLCVNRNTCPGSQSDCFTSYNVNASELNWNTTLSGLTPGSYYLLLSATKPAIDYQINVQVQRDTERQSLLLAWYYVILIAVGCIIISGAIVSLLFWRRKQKPVYIQVHS